jgi:glycerophosphoryl diester phosphodiesterase
VLAPGACHDDDVRMPRLPGVDSLRIPKRRRGPALSLQRQSPVRPLVIAHRGASQALAEHTLNAYRLALEAGADGLECDVRLTADGHLVCVHDRRIDRTSNGHGALSTLELNKLQSLDWSSWKQPWGDLDDEAPDVDPGGATILTLERLLDTVRDWGRPVEVSIETKHPTRYAGLVERRLVELLDRYGWARPRRGRSSPARVMSFSWLSLRRCLEMAPRLETVYLMDRVPMRFRDGSLPLGVGIAGPSIDILRAHPEYVDKVHAAGSLVHVWTVNRPADVRLCGELGVDAVITDLPGEALRWLDEGE